KKAGKRITEVFDEAIFDHLSKKEETSSFSMDLKDHSSYEHDCCREIKKLGWTARVTPGSGDQGVDILAEKGGVKIAFQCKLYNERLVGNSAVQQVKSGGDYFRCDVFVVISNAEYSKSSKELASSLGVCLIHHSEIGRFLSSIEGGKDYESGKKSLSGDCEECEIFLSAMKGDVINVSAILESMTHEKKREVLGAAKLICDLK
ncbi:restriction endonuclease, partial [Halomonas almeriensis]|uniref:restriction endonuclease n=1 Tax=Halomonas almeriensis TaxID=308163 RepID=UPI0025B56F62